MHWSPMCVLSSQQGRAEPEAQADEQYYPVSNFISSLHFITILKGQNKVLTFTAEHLSKGYVSHKRKWS